MICEHPPHLTIVRYERDDRFNYAVHLCQQCGYRWTHSTPRRQVRPVATLTRTRTK